MKLVLYILLVEMQNCSSRDRDVTVDEAILGAERRGKVMEKIDCDTDVWALHNDSAG